MLDKLRTVWLLAFFTTFASTTAWAQHCLCCGLLDVDGDWIGAGRPCRECLDGLSEAQAKKACEQPSNCQPVKAYCESQPLRVEPPCENNQLPYSLDFSCDCNADDQPDIEKNFTACVSPIDIRDGKQYSARKCEEFIDIPPPTVPRQVRVQVQEFLSEESLECSAFDCKKRRIQCIKKADKEADKCGLLRLTPPGRDNRACNRDWFNRTDRCYAREERCLSRIFEDYFGPLPEPVPTPTQSPDSMN